MYLKFSLIFQTEGSEVLRICYHAMKHQSGDIIRPKDCILLRSGCKKTDLPYVAKVAHLWEDPEDGESKEHFIIFSKNNNICLARNQISAIERRPWC